MCLDCNFIFFCMTLFFRAFFLFFILIMQCPSGSQLYKCLFILLFYTHKSSDDLDPSFYDWWIDGCRLKRIRGVSVTKRTRRRCTYTSAIPLLSPKLLPPIMSDSFTTFDTLLFIGTVLESSFYGASHIEKPVITLSHISPVQDYTVSLSLFTRAFVAQRRAVA